MRGLTLEANDASKEADEKYYLKRMKEIVEEFPNKGPPLLSTRLAPHIYIGSQRNADDVPHLERLGITHVLNCAGTRRFDLTRSPYPKDSGIKSYLLIPAEDHDEFNIRSYFPDAIKFLENCKHSSGRALVHCNLGVNRSGAICAAYLMVDQHMTLLEVIRYLKTKRSVVLYNKGFRRQLYRFAKHKGLLDPVINTGLTAESNPDSSRSKRSSSSDKNSYLSPSSAYRDRSSRNLTTGLSLDSATAGASGYQTSSSRSRSSFGSRFFKRYGRSLSNSVVEEEIARHKPVTSSSSKDYGSKSKDDPRESRFARSFLTLPRRSSSSNNNNNNKSPPQKMETLPENLPVKSFSDKASAASKRSAYRERGLAIDKNDDLVEKYQHTGFSTTLLPGAKLRSRSADHQNSGGDYDRRRKSEDEPSSPKSLSTSRPLRVYKRSATDSEVYRSRRQAKEEEGAAGGNGPKTPRSPGSENNLDKLSRDFTAFSFQPDALPMKTRTASSPEHCMEETEEDLPPQSSYRGHIRPITRKISAE